MMMMMIHAWLFLALLPVSLCLVRWDQFANCLQTRFNGHMLIDRHVVCATRKLFINYRRSIYCRNCDKYFHCQGNYEAVFQCSEDPKAYKAAEAISLCREQAQGGGNTADNIIYDGVNKFGRNGGDCVREYLENNEECHYNPATLVCNNTRFG
ncbi:uncharacterized protein LOC135395381 [Ornithodoros turicata]|uniref:uncharacterized protein LOC135395381 n=1 Tax=Ornithodoros turicata TaxID=34597 RepID=UPI003138A39F